VNIVLFLLGDSPASEFYGVSQWRANFFRSGQKKNLAGHNDLL